MTDYKKYALGQVENYLYDAMFTEATPKEIYDTIRNVVQDNLNHYTKSADKSRELLSLLNGHRPVDLDFCDTDNPSEYCKNSWNDFWEEVNQYTDDEISEMCDAAEKADKVIKWSLPVEEVKDADTDETEYFVTFPDDLLEAADLKEGDQLEWVDQGDGSFKIVKVTKPLGTDEC
jgi:hypothetical protein